MAVKRKRGYTEGSSSDVHLRDPTAHGIGIPTLSVVGRVDQRTMTVCPFCKGYNVVPLDKIASGSCTREAGVPLFTCPCGSEAHLESHDTECDIDSSTTVRAKFLLTPGGSHPGFPTAEPPKPVEVELEDVVNKPIKPQESTFETSDELFKTFSEEN